ncbi:MAG: hypothetical protein WCK32_02665 [Chlorobiaceae bacterium]
MNSIFLSTLLFAPPAGSETPNPLIQLIPMILVQCLYAIFTYKVAEKTNKNKALYVVITLIPVLGSLFFFITILTSILYALDEIKKPKN